MEDEIPVEHFQQFNTWEDLVKYYGVPKNEIRRIGGPGDAIKGEEWYLTLCDLDSTDGDTWYLSYVEADGRTTRIMDRLPEEGLRPIQSSWPSSGWGGTKDGWGSKCKVHYKVDIDNIVKFGFLNWINENPFEVKQ